MAKILGLAVGPEACSPEKSVEIWASSQARIRVQTDIIISFLLAFLVHMIKHGLIKTSPEIFIFFPDDTMQSKSIINSINKQSIKINSN